MFFRVPLVKPPQKPPKDTHPGEARYERWFQATIEYCALQSRLSQPEIRN